jgi:peptide deformylase
MAILPIYTYNHPALKQAAAPVEQVNEELAAFVKHMFETMRNADGIGLAANQVGDPRAVAVIDIGEIEESSSRRPLPPLALINPVIQYFSDETSEAEEGCLSLPTYRDAVTRPEKIQVRFYDLQMHEHILEAEGLLARVIQHELDHLQGTYFFDRLSPVKKAMGHPKLRRIQLGHVRTNYPIISSRNAAITSPPPAAQARRKKR